MTEYLYLGRVGYDEGLRLQAEMASLVAAGRLGNLLLLLEHPAVLTLGRNANRANVLADNELLALRGIALHETNRGGDVTYHGPGQLVGYPIFDLRSLTSTSGGRMGPVDFVRGMEDVLIRVCLAFGVRASRVHGLTGVWCSRVCAGSLVESGEERKIGAIGIHVAKGITSHGFALNVTTDLRDFELIVPCGIRDHAVTSLEKEMANVAEQKAEPVPSLESVAHRAAREFGTVFDQQVLAVESLEALRSHTTTVLQFPAEDTPLQVPAAVGRLRGAGERPVQA
jgi:lipoyl(octanoyl) transferase